jgi:Family of unknown function (DUF5681)
MQAGSTKLNQPADQNDRSAKANNYSVGYGRPPKHSQFKPGQSGNPKGRPKKASTTLRAELFKLYTDPITLREGNKKHRVPRLVAIHRRQVEQALKGDQRAIQGSLKIAMMLELLDQAAAAQPLNSYDLSREEIAQLTDEELEEFLTIQRREREFLIITRERLRSPASKDAP